MIDFENEVAIGRAVEDVFAYLAAFENVPRWNHAIEETVRISEGPVGVGSAYRQRRSIPRPAEETFEVIAFEPPRRLGIRGTIGPFPAELEYELEAGGGGTRLINRVRLLPRGPRALAARAGRARIREAVARNLGTLKSLLEGG